MRGGDAQESLLPEKLAFQQFLTKKKVQPGLSPAGRSKNHPLKLSLKNTQRWVFFY